MTNVSGRGGTELEALDLLAVQFLVCPRCEARPGKECVSITGEPARRAHSSRVRPMYLAFSMGESYAQPLTESAR